MNKFWKKFDELMDSLPDYIEEQVDKFGDSIDKFTDDNSVSQVSVNGKSTTTIMQNGKKIVIKSVNKKTTITVNGKEYVEK